ncbi:MAG: hypothetical protein AB1921_00525 [Thermodesulfobacteriota bacterium]
MGEKTPDTLVSSYRIKIHTPPEKIFPLLCPVREEEWIAGWKPGIYRVLKSQSGFVEKDSEFVENSLCKFLFGKTEQTRWVTTRYEPDRFHQDFTLYVGGRAVILREIRLAEPGGGTTEISWTDTVTFLKDPPSAPGRAVLAVKMRIFSNYLGRILKHYCEKGRIFPVPAVVQRFTFRPL